MGIKSLNKFLKKNCLEVFKEVNLSEYAYKKVAIDISLYIFKYKATMGDRWLDAFINLVSCLRRNEVHCVFVYDTKSPPEKENELKERASQREKLKDKIETLKSEIDEYYRTNEISEFLLDLYNRKKPEKIKSLLVKKKEQFFDITIVENELQKITNQDIGITKKDIEATKNLFDSLGIKYVSAEYEAETLCAQLCVNNKVYGVLSEDTDVFAYGAPKFLSKINTKDDICIEVDYNEILNSLDLTREQFTDLCIMCGTDYNSNIYRIGPEKSFKLIKKHSSIDNIPLDTSILNHERGRELFSTPSNINVEVSYCEKPDFNKVKGVLFKNNCRVGIDSIKKAFKPKEIVFVD